MQFIVSQYKASWEFIKSRLARLFLFGCIFFSLITLLMYIILAKYPEYGRTIIASFISSKQDIMTGTQNQATSASYFWPHMRTTGLLFLNNIKANFIFSVIGVLPFWALPTVCLVVNSFVIAAALAIVNTPFKTLLFGIMPHGIFELSSWFLAAAIGLYINTNLCEAYLKKTHDSVKYVFKNAGICFLLFVVPLTLIAAFVEAFLTPEIISAFFK